MKNQRHRSHGETLLTPGDATRDQACLPGKLGGSGTVLCQPRARGQTGRSQVSVEVHAPTMYILPWGSAQNVRCANISVLEAQQDAGRGRETSEPIRPPRCRGLSASDLSNDRRDSTKRQAIQEPCQDGSRDRTTCMFSLHPNLKVHAVENETSTGGGPKIHGYISFLLSVTGISRVSSLVE